MWWQMLYAEIEELGLELVIHGYVASLELRPTIVEENKEAQKGHDSIEAIKRSMLKGKSPGFSEDEHGVVWYKGRICVPNKRELKDLLLQEAHDTPYSIHPGGTKMYQDLKEKFWWHDIKREIATYVAKCYTCQRIKAEHQWLARLLQPLKIPEWKRDKIGMDFIAELPKSNRGHDAIWVIVNHLTKVVHFIPVSTTYRGNQLAELYIHRIVSLHGIPKEIVSDQGTQFTSRFWGVFQKALGTNLSFSTAFHPQTGG